jgi:hypothetical protein
MIKTSQGLHAYGPEERETEVNAVNEADAVVEAHHQGA